MDKNYTEYVNDLAQLLRHDGARVVVDYSEGKVATKIKNADRAKIPFFALIGEQEKTSGHIKVKTCDWKGNRTDGRQNRSVY